MSHLHRGPRATLPYLSLLVAAACGGADDDATSVAQSSTDSSPPTTSTTEPAESSGTAPAESSTTDGPADSSGTASTDATESSGGEGTEGSTDGSTTEATGLEIAGAWFDDFGGEHIITDEVWETTFAPDTFGYTIAQYDNADRVVFAQDDGDDSWSKYEWTYLEDELYYCQTGFGLDTLEDAMATPDADPGDPAASGCGGFAWSRLLPQD